MVIICIFKTMTTTFDRLIDLPVAKICICESGIMHVHIKVEDEFTIEHAEELFKARTEMANGRKMPIMYTSPKFVIPSKEVREYVASEDRSELVLADAFVTYSLPQRLMSRFYLRFNKPVRPTQFFESEERALEWLRTFL